MTRTGAVPDNAIEREAMDPIVIHLLRSRDLTVPVEDEGPLEKHWSKMRSLRSQVDEALLTDHEIAVTYTAVEEQA